MPLKLLGPVVPVGDIHEWDNSVQLANFTQEHPLAS